MALRALQITLCGATRIVAPHMAACLHSRRLFHAPPKASVYEGAAPLCEVSEEQEALKDMVYRLAVDKIAPKVEHMDRTMTMDKEIIQDCFEYGLMAIEAPEEYGGAGMGFHSTCLAIEQLARVDPSVSALVDVQNTLVGTSFLNFGTEAQKAEFLPRLATNAVGAFALSETGAGSDAFALKMAAVPSGEEFILNGSKFWITSANEADIFVVFATVDPSKGYKGITAFLVERGQPGFTVGKKEDKLGIRASSTCELILEDVKVHKDRVLGQVGKGYKIAIETLNEGRIGIASQMVGLSQGAFDTAMGYIGQRKQFGRPVADFQGLQFQYAKAAAEIHAARLMVYEACRMKDAGKNILKEAAMAKYFASEIAVDVATKCVEWFGGMGFTRETPIEKYYRDSIIGRIYEGTSNMNLATIAKAVQAKYRQ